MANQDPFISKKALDVIDYQFHNDVFKPSRSKKPYGDFSRLVSCPYFTVNRYEFDSKFTIYRSRRDRFESLILVEGNCKIECNDEKIIAKKGDSIYIPPSCSDLVLSPFEHSELIEIFVD